MLSFLKKKTIQKLDRLNNYTVLAFIFYEGVVILL